MKRAIQPEKKKKGKSFHIIPIDEDYRLYVEKTNIQLQEDDNGNWKEVGNYSTIGPALNGYCNSVVKHSKSIDDIIDKLEQIQREFERLNNIFTTFESMVNESKTDLN